jgi:hypothetical protein
MLVDVPRSRWMAMASALRCATCHGKKSCSCREVTKEDARLLAVVGPAS